jgi:hypothetical protein
MSRTLAYILSPLLMPSLFAANLGDVCTLKLAETVLKVKAADDLDFDLRQSEVIGPFRNANGTLNDLYRESKDETLRSLHQHAKEAVKLYEGRPAAISSAQKLFDESQGDFSSRLKALQTRLAELRVDHKGFRYSAFDYPVHDGILQLQETIPGEPWREFMALRDSLLESYEKHQSADRQLRRAKAVAQPDAATTKFASTEPRPDESALDYIRRSQGTDTTRNIDELLNDAGLDEELERLVLAEIATAKPHRYQEFLEGIKARRENKRSGLLKELQEQIHETKKLAASLEQKIKTFDQTNPAIVAIREELKKLKEIAEKAKREADGVALTATVLILLYEWIFDDRGIKKDIESVRNRINELEKQQKPKRGY